MGESPPNTLRSRPGLKDDTSLCATICTVGGVGELHKRYEHFFEIVTLYTPPPHHDWGRARTAGNRLARNDKELGPQQLGETIT